MAVGTTRVGDAEQLLAASRGCSELASLVRTAGDFPRSDLDDAAGSLSGANWDGQLGAALRHLATRWTDQCDALHTTYQGLGQKTWDTWSAYTGVERANTATFNGAHADMRATFG
ncbi:hypothetical protein [Streptomyces sp. V3I7]|uniref:hypothetical protein n=1 Tax=Streptomyces sp. V3I7 TaxID=3042278 RepID=UPI00277EE564|nr:hypothetical protein [Streptomyces sp. V3I7]MDQ0991129.1 hypothetical protein [Streptomyces sp. V3I7]